MVTENGETLASNFLHYETFIKDNQYLYIFRNCFKQLENQVYIYDLEAKEAYGVKCFENNRGSGFRFNYSAAM